MKIAVSSQNLKTITSHAGKCRNFRVYDIENKEIIHKTLLELTLEQSFHESHAEAPHPLDGVDVLISGSAGANLLSRLDGMGIQSVVTPQTDPDSAVNAFLNGTLILGQAEAHGKHGEHKA